MVLRILWALAVACAFAGFWYFFAKNVTRYTAFPKNSVTETKNVNQLPFPAITICNFNQFQADKTIEYSVERDSNSIALFLCKLLEYPMCINNATVDRIIRADTTPASELYKLLGQDAFDLLPVLQQALLQSAAFTVNVLKNMTPKIVPVVTGNGLCQTINPEGVLNATNIGVFGGMRLSVNINPEQYFGTGTLSTGLKVILHSPGRPVMPSQEGFAISPGNEVFVSMSASRVARLGKPYSKADCVKENTLRFYKKYTRSACLLECLAFSVADVCKCVLPGLQNTSEVHLDDANGRPVTKACTLWDIVTCVQEEKEKFQKNGLEACPACLLPCQDEGFLYSADLSFAKFPSSLAACTWKYFLTNQTSTSPNATCTFAEGLEIAEQIGARNAILNFFFERLAYEDSQQQVAYEVDSLFGDVGGNLGLFVGASMLTLVEFTQYVLRAIRAWYKKSQVVDKIHADAFPMNF